MRDYSIVHCGKTYELEPYSIRIADEVEKVGAKNASNITMREKCKGLYDFIVAVIGKDATKEVCGELSSSDPNELNIVFLKIVNAYNKPLYEYQSEQATERLNVEEVDRITKLMETMSKIDIDKLNSIR